MQTTPYEALYGQAPPHHMPYLVGSSQVESVDWGLQTKETAKGMLRFHLKRAQERMR